MRTIIFMLFLYHASLFGQKAYTTDFFELQKDGISQYEIRNITTCELDLIGEYYGKGKRSLNKKDAENLLQLKNINKFILAFDKRDPIPKELFLLPKLEELFLYSYDSTTTIDANIIQSQSLRKIYINYRSIKQNNKFLLEDSLNFIWQNSNLEYVSENFEKSKISVGYSKKTKTLSLKRISCNEIDFFMKSEVKEIIMDETADSVLNSCWCEFKNLEKITIKLGSLDKKTPVNDFFPCLQSMPNLKNLSISSSLIHFNIFQMHNLDSLYIDSPWRLKKLPKLSEIRLDSLDYLYLDGVKMSQVYMWGLRRKLAHAEVHIHREVSDYERNFTISYSNFFALMDIDIAYLPLETFRWGVHYRPGFGKKTDSHGKIANKYGNFTGGVHFLSIGGGMLISKHAPIGFVELGYDYYLPTAPLFFGFAVDAYIDAKNQQFRTYARPRLGACFMFKNGRPLVSFWYSYGIPLAETPMPNVPNHEIGVRITFPPTFGFGYMTTW